MLRKENIKKTIFLFLIFVFSIFVFLYIRASVYSNGVQYDLVMEDGTEYEVPVQAGSVVEFNYQCEMENIRSILLRFGYDKMPDTGSVTLNLIDSSDGSVLGSTTVGHDFLADSDYSVFDMGNIVHNVKGKQIKVQMVFNDFIEGQLNMYFVENGQPLIKIVSADEDEYCTLVEVIYIVLILMTMVVLSLALYKKNFKIETAYLILVLGYGFISTLIITLMVAPDEFTHCYIAYELSNNIMGIDPSPNGTLMMRYDDAKTYFEPIYIGRAYFDTYYDRFFDGLSNGELIDSGIKAANAPFYLYIFSGLGITVGRLLGLGTTLTLMLGRWFNLLLFGLVSYFAMKKMPFGKPVVFIWGILPIMLQQVASYSYDCGINTLSIVTIAMTLHVMYGEKPESKVKRGVDVAILVIAALLLIPCKGHAIVPISLLPIMIVVKLIWDNKTKIKDFLNEKKVRKYVFVAASVLVLLACVAVLGIILKSLLANADGNGDYIEWAESYAHPMGYYIKNPKTLISIFINTIWSKGDEYLYQMLGATLGWLEVDVPFIFIIPFFVLFFYAGARNEDEQQPIAIASKLWMWIIFLGICFLACLGMLLYWTPASSGIILGGQGRYFLPGLTLPFIAARTKTTCVSKDRDRVVACAVAVAYLFVVTALVLEPL